MTDQPPKRTQTRPMITAHPAPPVKPPPPPVVVSRVVELSSSAPPPTASPIEPVPVSKPRPPQATLDWSADFPSVEPSTAQSAQSAPPVPAAIVPPPPPAAAVLQRRPAAPTFGTSPAASTAGSGPWAMDTVDSLLDDVDAGFDSILGEDGPRTQRTIDATESPAKRPSGGMSDARALFAQIAAGHVRHVRDFMIDVKASQARTEWVAVCEPAIRSIRQMGDQLAMSELCTALDAFGTALAKAGKERTPQVEGAAREALLDAYAPLIASMPTAFALDEARSAREGIIVQALLLQIPEVRKVTLDKLYAAGLTSLDVYNMAKPAEIAETTGLPLEVAKKISDKFKSYKKELEGAKVDADRSFEHGRLAELATALEEHQEAFDAAEQDGDSKKKREARKAREEVLLEVKVLLARLGEVDRLAAMDKLPFAQKVAELEAYLDEARVRSQRGRQ